MFTPLTQGKESRIVGDPHPFIGGRFKAHPAAHIGGGSSSGGGDGGQATRRSGGAPLPPSSTSVAHDIQRIFTAAGPSPRTPTSTRRRRTSQRFRDEREGERAWLLRPSRERVESWLNAWWKRWMLLVVVPSLIVWAWCAIPFPVSDPYAPHPWPDPRWNWTRPSLEWWNFPREGHAPYSIEEVIRSLSENKPDVPEDLPVDINFWFFLFIYYGAYLAVALIWVTCLFNLYRLNWWPKKLGGAASYATFWAGSLAVGAITHYVDLFGMEQKRRGRTGRNREGNSIDWERKTFWVTLAFVTMSLPAVVCFGKLRKDRRMTYRHSLTETQKTFLERQLGARIPKSYIRFLWFLGCILLAILAGIAGQAYMAVYLGTLPHGSIESIVYVWTWILTSSLLGGVTTWILEKKVGSRALDFVFRLYFQLTYHVFYRTLFARLRKAEQFLYLQALSSIWIIIFYPAYMSRSVYKIIGWLFGNDRSYAEHADTVAVSLYIRNLSENVTMFAFLGWLTILHFGPNREVYPFFDFAATDVYNYQRTALSSLIIWFFELLSSFCSRLLCNMSFNIDVTNTGLNTLRDYPELLPACVWASVHVCMDILLFLVTYNFR